MADVFSDKNNMRNMLLISFQNRICSHNIAVEIEGTDSVLPLELIQFKGRNICSNKASVHYQPVDMVHPDIASNSRKSAANKHIFCNRWHFLNHIDAKRFQLSLSCQPLRCSWIWIAYYTL